MAWPQKKKKAIKKNKVNPYILLERCPRYTVKEKQQVREQYQDFKKAFR